MYTEYCPSVNPPLIQRAHYQSKKHWHAHPEIPQKGNKSTSHPMCFTFKNRTQQSKQEFSFNRDGPCGVRGESRTTDYEQPANVTRASRYRCLSKQVSSHTILTVPAITSRHIGKLWRCFVTGRIEIAVYTDRIRIQKYDRPPSGQCCQFKEVDKQKKNLSTDESDDKSIERLSRRLSFPALSCLF